VDLTKYLYVKVYNSENQSQNGRVLQVCNMEMDVRKKDLKSIFSVCGEIEDVTLHYYQNELYADRDTKNKTLTHTDQQPTSSQALALQQMSKKLEEEKKQRKKLTLSEQVEYATILFKESTSVDKFMNKANVANFWSTFEEPKTRGLAKWMTNFNTNSKLDSSELLAETNKILSCYDHRQEKNKRKLKEISGGVDEDGWITVTKNKKGKHIDEKTGIGVGVVRGYTERSLLDLKAKEKKHEQNNFYKFQNLEGKRAKIDILQEKFKEDKLRLEKMRQSRKFHRSL